MCVDRAEKHAQPIQPTNAKKEHNNNNVSQIERIARRLFFFLPSDFDLWA